MGRASDKRKARIRSLLMSTLAEIVRDELNDPRLGLFSITDIELAKDLSCAKVKISAVGGEESARQCVAVLTAAAPLLWNRLRDATDLRFVPELRFDIDHGLEYQAEIDRLLLELPPVADGDDGDTDHDTGVPLAGEPE